MRSDFLFKIYFEILSPVGTFFSGTASWTRRGGKIAGTGVHPLSNLCRKEKETAVAGTCARGIGRTKKLAKTIANPVSGVQSYQTTGRTDGSSMAFHFFFSAQTEQVPTFFTQRWCSYRTEKSTRSGCRRRRSFELRCPCNSATVQKHHACFEW